MRRISVEITTAADGSATAYSSRVSGSVHAIVYEKVDFADGVDFTVTAEKTGEQIWAESNVNAAASRYPRRSCCFCYSWSPVQAPGPPVPPAPFRMLRQTPR